MPYTYRKLSPEERKAILQYRAPQGRPLHAPPHPYQLSGCYLLTASNFEHVPLMAASERRSDFEARLLLGLHEAAIEVLAWVILPNHYHLLVQTETLLKVARVLKLLHGRTSREWNLADGQTGQRRVWYHYSDRRIRDEAHLARALITYISIPSSMAMRPMRTPGRGRAFTITWSNTGVTGCESNGA